MTGEDVRQEPVPADADGSESPGFLHGTYSGSQIHGCRCGPCTAARSAYDRRRDRLIGYGLWRPFTDAEPVRGHVCALLAAGIGRRRIARLAGVHQSVLCALLYGKAGRPPVRRVRLRTAAALLALEPQESLLAGKALVDATGYRRRMQALVAVGFPAAFLAGRLGVDRTNIRLEPSLVTAATDRRAREVYDALWDADPRALGVSPHSYSRSRNRAASQGWPVPQAWDDDRIGDPQARPRGVRREAA